MSISYKVMNKDAVCFNLLRTGAGSDSYRMRGGQLCGGLPVSDSYYEVINCNYFFLNKGISEFFPYGFIIIASIQAGYSPHTLKK